jgi:hypothetical protein
VTFFQLLLYRAIFIWELAHTAVVVTREVLAAVFRIRIHYVRIQIQVVRRVRIQFQFRIQIQALNKPIFSNVKKNFMMDFLSFVSVFSLSFG